MSWDWQVLTIPRKLIGFEMLKLYMSSNRVVAHGHASYFACWLLALNAEVNVFCACCWIFDWNLGGGKEQQQLKKRKWGSKPAWVSFQFLSLPFAVHMESLLQFAWSCLFCSLFASLISWMFYIGYFLTPGSFFNVVYAHSIFLWLLLSVSVAPEIKTPRLGNELQ